MTEEAGGKWRRDGPGPCSKSSRSSRTCPGAQEAAAQEKEEAAATALLLLTTTSTLKGAEETEAGRRPGASPQEPERGGKKRTLRQSVRQTGGWLGRVTVGDSKSDVRARPGRPPHSSLSAYPGSWLFFFFLARALAPLPGPC